MSDGMKSLKDALAEEREKERERRKAVAIQGPGRRGLRALMRQMRREGKVVYLMAGNVPEVVEEDREFFLLFQESKALEKEKRHQEGLRDVPALYNPVACAKAGDAYWECMKQMRARWAELTGAVS